MGSYPDTGVARVIEKALAAREQIQDGSDPILARMSERAIPTFEKSAQRWLRLGEGRRDLLCRWADIVGDGRLVHSCGNLSSQRFRISKHGYLVIGGIRKPGYVRSRQGGHVRICHQAAELEAVLLQILHDDGR